MSVTQSRHQEAAVAFDARHWVMGPPPSGDTSVWILFEHETIHSLRESLSQNKWDVSCFMCKMFQIVCQDMMFNDTVSQQRSVYFLINSSCNSFPVMFLSSDSFRTD
jgi:hypothetical protein